jgi:hypothetical protein
MIVRPPVFERDVLMFDEAGFAEAGLKGRHFRSISLRGTWAKDPNYRPYARLRARRERQGDRRATYEHHELAPFHARHRGLNAAYFNNSNSAFEIGKSDPARHFLGLTDVAFGSNLETLSMSRSLPLFSQQRTLV